MSLNKVMLIGRLGKDPEVRQAGDSKVANFSIATSEKYKNKQQETVENTEWHNIVLWRNLAELAEKYLTKGSQIYIEGKLTTRKWQDQNGNDRWTTEVVGSQMRFLGGDRKQNASAPVQQASVPQPQVQSPPAHIPSPNDDQLPF